MAEEYKKLSRFLCVVLRHDPSAAGVYVNEHGWANADELIGKVAATGREISREKLEALVASDSKTRYSFSADGTMIRCNHGHTIKVDLELPATQPPEFLLHGTGDVNVPSIDQQGLKPVKRMYVHMTDDEATAIDVGSRHGKPVIYRVHTGAMAKDGYAFYRSVSGVWLTDRVPVGYLEKMQGRE